MEGCPLDELTRREEQPHGLVGVRPLDPLRARPDTVDVAVGQRIDHGFPACGTVRQIAIAGTRAGVDDQLPAFGCRNPTGVLDGGLTPASRSFASCRRTVLCCRSARRVADSDRRPEGCCDPCKRSGGIAPERRESVQRHTPHGPVTVYKRSPDCGHQSVALTTTSSGPFSPRISASDTAWRPDSRKTTGPSGVRTGTGSRRWRRRVDDDTA